LRVKIEASSYTRGPTLKLLEILKMIDDTIGLKTHDINIFMTMVVIEIEVI